MDLYCNSDCSTCKSRHEGYGSWCTDKNAIQHWGDIDEKNSVYDSHVDCPFYVPRFWSKLCGRESGHKKEVK